MSKSIKTLVMIILILGFLILLGYRFLILMSGMHPIPPRTQLLNKLSGTQIVEIQAYQDQVNIHGLLLEVNGNISDSLNFTLGINDSTTYQTKQLAPGIVGFKYGIDWYSELCILTFVPTKDSVDGELQIKYKFFGD